VPSNHRLTSQSTPEYGWGTAQVLSLGSVPFPQARHIQDMLAEALVASDIPPTLLLLEHPHVFTLGSRALRPHLLWDEETLRARAVEVHTADRGGEITYHGPGQLIAYLIVPLGHLNTAGRIPVGDYTGFLRNLERMVILALAEFGIVSGQAPGLTGVWIQPDVASRCRHCPPAARRHPSKIASIGVRVDAHGVTRHGLALNVAPDMSYWQGIVACGLPDTPAISMADLVATPPAMAAVQQALTHSFARVFGIQDLRTYRYA
jgi:lipoyl(octanoyl) transferase